MRNQYANLELPNGVYVWVCKSAGEIIDTGKVIIE